MHIPDGFLSPSVWAPLDIAALPGVAWVARRARLETEDRSIPLMGVMGAFVFAAQMINFPVGLGTSGHLVGGALLSIALGPAAASVVMTAILVVQAFVFQDGGIMALGANVFNMAIAGVLAGYIPYRFLNARWRTGAIFFAGMLSVLTSALLALSELWVSGVRLPNDLPLWLTLGLFVLNGLLEGAITVAAVGAIGRLNPTWIQQPEPSNARAKAVFASAALLLVVFGILLASEAPDAIQRLTNISLPEVSSAWLHKAGAGLGGMALIFVACALTSRFFARRQRSA
jgi:cobalt/nickel transport system permease protein